MNRIIQTLIIACTIIGMGSLSMAGSSGFTVNDLKSGTGTYNNVQLIGWDTKLCADQDGFDPSEIGNMNIWEKGNEQHARTLTDRYYTDAQGTWAVEFACGADIEIPGRETAGKVFAFKYLFIAN